MKLLKRIFKEPYNWPDKSPIEILEQDYCMHPIEIDTVKGQKIILQIEFDKLKHAIWKRLTE